MRILRQGGEDIYLFVLSETVLLLRITIYLHIDVQMVLYVLIFLCLLQIYKTHCGLFNLYFGDCSLYVLGLLWEKFLTLTCHSKCVWRNNRTAQRFETKIHGMSTWHRCMIFLKFTASSARSRKTGCFIDTISFFFLDFVHSLIFLKQAFRSPALLPFAGKKHLTWWVP
jgi:hypothetical protein